jgi:hypothetical protein
VTTASVQGTTEKGAGCSTLISGRCATGGWGGRKSGGKFSGLSKGPEWVCEGIEATGVPSESINPRGHLEQRADNEGSSVAPTAQLAHLMTQLSNLLQQHAAGSSKSFNFYEILKQLANYAPKFANFC